MRSRKMQSMLKLEPLKMIHANMGTIPDSGIRLDRGEKSHKSVTIQHQNTHELGLCMNLVKQFEAGYWSGD
jgi:hypothetical protein